MSDPPDTLELSGESKQGPIRRSIEVEYWVIDDRGRLTDPEDLIGAAPGVEREFVDPLIEIKTSPCESTAELRTELFDRLNSVVRRADDHNKGLVPLATPVHDGEIDDLPSKRTEIQDRVLGEDFECVRHCAGTHIHVEQQPGREIDQLNTLTALDPALALVNSSPYFRNEYLTTGARSKLYRWLAYDDLPHQGELWRYAPNTEEWARRLERRYSEFVTEAVMAGYDRETVETCFTPESAVWTPVKLRDEFSTVEWRSPDTALPSQVVRLADDLVGVIEQLMDAKVRIRGKTGCITDKTTILPEFDTVQTHVESAISDGLSSSDVRSYLDRFGFDTDAYSPLSEDLTWRRELTARDARELRLECADRLKTDLRQSIAAGAD